MSLTDKFANFEVKQESRISEEDKNYLETYQAMYEHSLNYFKKVYDLFIEEQNQRTKYQKDVFGNVTDLKSVDMARSYQTNFPKEIYAYFSNKYKVTLNDKKFAESLDYKYKYCGYIADNEEKCYEMFKPQNYNTYLEDILNQMGGYNFEDVAVQQLKERMREASYNKYSDKWDFTVKGNTIKYEHGSVSKEYYHDYYTVWRSDFLKELPSCMSRFLYGDDRKLPGMDFWYGWDIKVYEEDFQSPIMFPEGSKIVSLKFYKNGRLDIKFATPEDARNFARNWLGYTLV